MKALPFVFLLFILPICAISQNTKLNPSDFLTTGSASPTGTDCFQLTAPVVWQGGTVWYKQPISLREVFNMELDLMFGCDDEGADGMVFIFHPSLKNGFQGEGMGFGGLSPALGIEMDTYENPHLADPYYDHLALMKNGKMHHDLSISKTVSLLPGNKNIEDCSSHRVKINWNPDDYHLRIFIDGSLRLSTHYDIVKNIFNGSPIVYWGISSATGGQHNLHKVCMEKLEFTSPVIFDKNTQQQLLEGVDYTLENVSFLSGKTKLAASSTSELDKLVSFLKAYPEHHVYIKGHTDDIGSAKSNTAISQRRADEVKRYLIENGITKDRIKAAGYGEDFPKVKNSSPENREINRRVDIFITIPKA